MSATIEILSRTLKNLLILGLIALASGPTPLHAARSCASIVPLAAGETWRQAGGDAGDDVCFDLDLDAAGTLLFEVSTAATAAPARLSLLGPQDDAEGAVTRLRQSATSLLLAAGAGSYRLRVEAEDPRQALPSFVLRSRFAAGAAKGETDSETEVDPDPIVAPPGAKGETDSETEVDPDPFAGGPHPSLHDLSAPLPSGLAALCRQGERDDHGDGFACATKLGRGRATGEIDNDWGDDGDVFRFRVKALGAVEIRAHGDAELVAELYDRHGQRLDLAIGDGGGLRRVRTLAPGAYFLRLEGRDGAAGRYALTVGAAAR